MCQQRKEKDEQEEKWERLDSSPEEYENKAKSTGYFQEREQGDNRKKASKRRKMRWVYSQIAHENGGDPAMERQDLDTKAINSAVLSAVFFDQSLPPRVSAILIINHWWLSSITVVISTIVPTLAHWQIVASGIQQPIWQGTRLYHELSGKHSTISYHLSEPRVQLVAHPMMSMQADISIRKQPRKRGIWQGPYR